MENIYNISETEIKRIVKDVVREALNEVLQKYAINEMAMSLSDYKKRVEAHMQQILENWCLVRYVTLTDDKLQLKNHWKRELAAHINQIAQIKLKNGNDISTKQNAIFNLWNMYDWDTDEACIAQRLFAKFQEEGIPTNTPEYAQVVSDFKKATKQIAYALVDASPTSVNNYIESI